MSLWPPLLIYVLPVTAGFLGSKRFGRLVNSLVMLAVFIFGLTLLLFINTGRFSPLLLIPGVGVLPGVGGVSPGGLIPPLVFVIVAILCAHRRAEIPG